MAATDPSACTARTQALCWLLDELFDAEDDLLELMARPGALTGWRQERLAEFCQRVGEGGIGAGGRADGTGGADAVGVRATL